MDSKPNIPLLSAGLRDSDAERYTCAHVGLPVFKTWAFRRGMMMQFSGGNAPLTGPIGHPTGYLEQTDTLGVRHVDLLLYRPIGRDRFSFVTYYR